MSDRYALIRRLASDLIGLRPRLPKYVPLRR